MRGIATAYEAMGLEAKSLRRLRRHFCWMCASLRHRDRVFEEGGEHANGRREMCTIYIYIYTCVCVIYSYT